MNLTSPGRVERVQTSGKLATITFGPQTLINSGITTTTTDQYTNNSLNINGIHSGSGQDVVTAQMPTRKYTMSSSKIGGSNNMKEIPCIENSIMPKVMHSSSKIDLERLYDDPCDLLDEWNTPARIPRSRSWLCCPQANQTIVQDQPLFDRSTLSSYEHTHLITDPPKLGQNHSIVSRIRIHSINLINFSYLSFIFSLQFNLAALSALNNDMIEMKSRLQKAEMEKEALKCQLREALEESVRSQRRLESIGAAHESRITEMHCVIVELNKKLKLQQESAIMEEPEGSGN